MKKTLFRLVCLTFFIISVLACRKEPTEVFYNQTIEYMKNLAGKENKLFCIVVSNTDCPPCTNYLEILGDQYRHLREKAIFNVVDVSLPENQWYRQWICSAATPTTCIFSPKGVLQAIVSGTAKQCLDCIESSIDGNTDCAGYLYSKRYQAADDVIPALNSILECKLKMDEGDNISEEIMPSLSRIQYPYNFYLKCLAEQQNGNRKEAVYWAKELLRFDDVYYLRLYGELYSWAKQIIDPDYDPTQVAVLSVEKELVLDGCAVNQPKLFSITVSNTGVSPLEITDISLSCSCLKLLGGKAHSIAPGKSESIEFVFTADTGGKLYREIAFVSNAGNALETVSITAIVK